MTAQILRDAINFIFVFMVIWLLLFAICDSKSTGGERLPDRTKMKSDGTYWKFLRNASGVYPVSFLKKRIKYETSSKPRW